MGRHDDDNEFLLNHHDHRGAVTGVTPVEAEFRNPALLDWYAIHRRNLPWRRTSDPYPVLVSEVMLQQTQVDRAIDRFERFIAHWPTVEELAGASNDDVLQEWSGLGYNSRALRLRDTARIVSTYGWPQTIPELIQLPGVGPYTAAAVASISFGAQAAAVDTNLKRVISRWHGEPLDGAALQSAADNELGTPAGDWNQALMDLGSSVCTIRDPNCGECPVSDWCTDPSIYEAPTRQPTFNGSNRQLRGALVKAHLNGEDLQSAGTVLGRSKEEIDSTITDLEQEGLIPKVTQQESPSG